MNQACQAAGYAWEAAELLATLKGAGALEPLLTGLRILTLADVAERIRDVAEGIIRSQ